MCLNQVSINCSLFKESAIWTIRKCFIKLINNDYKRISFILSEWGIWTTQLSIILSKSFLLGQLRYPCWPESDSLLILVSELKSNRKMCLNPKSICYLVFKESIIRSNRKRLVDLISNVCSFLYFILSCWGIWTTQLSIIASKHYLLSQLNYPHWLVPESLLIPVSELKFNRKKCV